MRASLLDLLYERFDMAAERVVHFQGCRSNVSDLICDRCLAAEGIGESSKLEIDGVEIGN